MAKTIDDLDRQLGEILKALQKTYKDQSGTSGNANPAPKTLKDHFQQAFAKNKQQGWGVEKALAGKAGELGSIAGRGYQMAGPVGAVAATVAAVGIELAKLPWQIAAFGEGLHQANRQFAAFSPSMAAVMAQSDIQDMMRKAQQGEQLAGSAGYLADQRGRLLDQLTPVETQWQRFKNNAWGAVEDVTATVLEKTGIADALTKTMETINDALGGEEVEKPDDWLQGLESIEKWHLDNIDRKRQPLRIRPRDANFNGPERGGGGGF